MDESTERLVAEAVGSVLTNVFTNYASFWKVPEPTRCPIYRGDLVVNNITGEYGIVESFANPVEGPAVMTVNVGNGFVQFVEENSPDWSPAVAVPVSHPSEWVSTVIDGWPNDDEVCWWWHPMWGIQFGRQSGRGGDAWRYSIVKSGFPHDLECMSGPTRRKGL